MLSNHFRFRPLKRVNLKSKYVNIWLIEETWFFVDCSDWNIYYPIYNNVLRFENREIWNTETVILKRIIRDQTSLSNCYLCRYGTDHIIFSVNIIKKTISGWFEGRIHIPPLWIVKKYLKLLFFTIFIIHYHKF